MSFQIHEFFLIKHVTNVHLFILIFQFIFLGIQFLITSINLLLLILLILLQEDVLVRIFLKLNIQLKKQDFITFFHIQQV